MEENKHKEASQMLMHYLRDLAKEKGITQEQIAQKTGFESSNVNRMLAGKYSPTLENFIKLADAIHTYFFVIDKEANDDLCETMRNRWGKSKDNQN
jgi:transcriptional regulator with XRE-family HTH domain